MKSSDSCTQFYDDDQSLVDSVTGFIRDGLEAGDVCFVIATPAHREKFEIELLNKGIDLKSAQDKRQYIYMDAAQTLATFMVNGTPDAKRFFQTIVPLIEEVYERGGCVRVFREMVALLWAEGNQVGAIQLERIWHDIVQQFSFSYLLAYPVSGFVHRGALISVGSQPTGVLPWEAPAENPENMVVSDGLQEITLLQQKARVLEAEIVHRKAVEKILSIRERELSDFFDNAVEGLRKVGADGTILWANKVELELLGYLPDEYIGHNITEFHVDEPVINSILAKLQCGEALYDYTARLRCKDNSIIHVLIHSNACFEDGQFSHTRCFTRDNTAAHIHEITQSRLAAIVNSSVDAIISKSLDGIITSWNKGAEKLFGYREDEAVGMPKTFIFPTDRLQEEVEILNRLANGESIDHLETVRVHKNGRLIDVSLTISLIKDSFGNIVGASTIARDITDMNRTLQELASLNARLERAVIETNHRVKNNLQLMSALIEMQKMEFKDSVPITEYTRLGNNIQALGLIHDILTRGATKDGDAETISAKQVLERFLPLLELTLNGRVLVKDFEEIYLPGKQTTSLTFIVNELVANSVKHGLGDILLTLCQQGNIVTLNVCDHGLGFPDGFDAETDACTGLDLVQNITRYDLRGDVVFQNRPDGGACVSVSFSII